MGTLLNIKNLTNISNIEKSTHDNQIKKQDHPTTTTAKTPVIKTTSLTSLHFLIRRISPHINIRPQIHRHQQEQRTTTVP